MNDLKNKVAIITGGSRGIGKACCLAFAKEGANIVFTYNKSEKEAKALETDIKNLNVQAFAMQADVKDYTQCRKVVEEALKITGRLDIVLNNAGVTRDKALMMMLQEDWKEVIDTNLGGTFNMTRAAITTLLKQKSGSVLNMSSVSGVVGLPRQTNYSASKAGIIGFTKALAKEVAAYGVRVNAICPGFIDTDMMEFMKKNPVMEKAVIDSIPQKRLGTPEDVARLCVFLASEISNYITGEVIKIDGGLAI